MSGVPQGLVLGPLLFLIYINDFSDGINSLCKVFPHDTSLFSKVYDIYNSASKLNDDLEKISYCAYQWKMQFNPDPNKQVTILMKLFSLEKQVQITYHIHLSNLTRLTFLNAPIKST